jgi:hypothetical protein
MKSILFSLLFCAVFGTSAEPKKQPQPPATFLQTNTPAWNRILDKEVSADFQNNSIREALWFIARKNGEVNLETRFGDKPHPKITRKLQNVPLRTALFLLAQDVGGRVIWEVEDGFQRGIIFTTE